MAASIRKWKRWAVRAEELHLVLPDPLIMAYHGWGGCEDERCVGQDRGGPNRVSAVRAEELHLVLPDPLIMAGVVAIGPPCQRDNSSASA